MKHLTIAISLIAALISLETQATETPENIVTGRCHMSYCWWWGIEKLETIQTENNKLIKVSVKTTDAEYSEAEMDSQGYPDLPAKNAQWSETSEAFIFCSKQLPAYIEYDKEQKKFIATVFVGLSGATEGIENLYTYVCRSQISLANPKFSDITLEKPTDIFNYTIK